MKGLIKKETQEGVWLDLGIGAVKFRWEEIEKIDRSGPEEADRIRQEWKREDTLVEKETGPKEVGFSKRGGHIFVNALLNNKVNATLVLDTGAPTVLLSERITKELGIKTQGLKTRTIAVVGRPDLRVVDTEMSERLKESFKRSYPQDKYEPVSFDFEEKRDLIMSHMAYINKTNNTWAKRYKVDVITKDEPVRGYNLSFICAEQYFDKFLSVFKNCLESFVINEYE